jgi:amino acid adenylation domain-containing protein
VTAGAARGIPRRAPEEPAPLSAAQQRFWMFERFWPGTAVYNRPLAVRLRGGLRIEALRSALRDVVARHESLRTVFTDAGGGAKQAVLPPDRVPSLTELDLSDTGAAHRESALEQAIVREAVRPFDLSASPTRALLIRVADDDHVLVITVHHIVFDGWSAGVMLEELAHCYDARCQGRDAELPALPIQCADHAAWQAGSLSTERVAASLDYWRATLDGAPDELALTRDRPRPTRRSFRGGRRSMDLSCDATAALARVARQRRATPFMVLLSAYAATLHRYTGDTDIVIGCPIAGRTHVELEPLIGCFINTLPIRLRVDGDRSFADQVDVVRRAALGAFAHQDLPLQSLVETLRPDRHANRPPLFQALFNFRNLPPRDVSMTGLQVEQMSVDTGTALVDLSLEIARIPNGKRIAFEYDADLFEGATIERMLRHFVTLLEAALESPDTTIAALPLIPQHEIRELLALGDGGDAPLPEGRGVHDLIAGRAAAAANEIAVEGEGERLTYSELMDCSQRIADALAAQGVGAGALVGVAVGRSVELIVALLGVLRAGAAYLPLDPEYPVARIRFMISDAGCSVILTRREDAERFVDAAATVLAIEHLLDEHAAPRAHAPRVEPDGPAYVMYTSGTTGTPKGVSIVHRGLTNHNLAVIEAFGLAPGDRVLQFASPSFDGSVEEIFPTLIAGATLVLRTAACHISARAFLGEIERLGITVLNLPTAFWHEWVVALPAGARLPRSLRLVIVGGELATVDAYRRWQALAGDRVRWLNTYGPTEATVVATIWDPERQPAPPDDPVLPIGRPLPNVRAYVLDLHARPVPVGVPGELGIGGVGVAAGYLNRPDLTTERFVPDPFSTAPDARLYRTGDRARWRSDGLLEFLGRVDGQLKIRGHRIEPGEIEAALREQPGVRDAAVVLRREAGAPRLVAYVAGDGTGTELRTALGEHLPSYMRPDAIVRLDALPRDGSGKIDRRALEQRSDESIAAPAAGGSPLTDDERRLLEIWREVLGVSDLGVHDEFFASGGHSLLALRLTSRIEAALDVQLVPTALFEHPTVARLARRLATGGTGSVAVPIQPDGTRLPFFCVHEFFGDVLVYGRLADALGADQPLYGLRAPGLDGAEAPLRDVPSLASRYIAAMKELQPTGPYALGGLCAGGVIAFEMAQQLTANGERVALLALLDSNARSPGTPASVADESGTADVLGGIAEWAAGAADLTSAQWKMLLRLKRRLIGSRLARAVGRRGNGAGAAYRVEALAAALRLSDRHRVVGMALREGLQRYVPRPYAGPAVLFRPRMQPRFGVGDRSRGWAALVTGGLTICTVPGNHLAMLQEPHVRVLARELAGRLGERGLRGAPPVTANHSLR